MFARNTRHVQIAAHSAMHIPDIFNGGCPGEKTRVAGATTPGAQPCHTRQIVVETSSAGAAGTVAMTDRTQQIIFSLRGPRQGYVKSHYDGKFDLGKIVVPYTIQQWVLGGRLQCGECARWLSGTSASSTGTPSIACCGISWTLITRRGAPYAASSRRAAACPRRWKCDSNETPVPAKHRQPDAAW
jgi:hypothetical protein